MCVCVCVREGVMDVCVCVRSVCSVWNVPVYVCVGVCVCVCE